MAEIEIDEDGNVFYYSGVIFHREDGPAINYFNGLKKWYIYHYCNRDDGPASDEPNGRKRWIKDDNTVWPKFT